MCAFARRPVFNFDMLSWWICQPVSMVLSLKKAGFAHLVSANMPTFIDLNALGGFVVKGTTLEPVK